MKRFPNHFLDWLKCDARSWAAEYRQCVAKWGQHDNLTWHAKGRRDQAIHAVRLAVKGC